MCPDPGLLQQFLEGRVAEAQAVELERHLQTCERCASTLHGLHSQDTLLQALRAAQRQPEAEPESAATQALRKRLSELPQHVGTADQPTRARPQDQNPATNEPTQRTPTFGFLAPPLQPDELGRLGSYRILKVLGQGGMGMVFQAEDPQLRRLVALKVMKPDLANGEEARTRFLQEARAMAAVKHEHIVTIYQVGQEGDVPFLAMEYLEGHSLEGWLRAGNRPTVPQIIQFGRQTALGLAAAHERGLIHRDIKPANLWLEGPALRIRILDFGLARAVNDDLHLTGTGQVLGTPAYMALEQARGEKVDGRSDLFSLGAVLYRLCTGKFPFPGTTVMAILAALAITEPQPIRQANPEIPADLARLIEELLARTPEQRPESALAVARRLEAMEKQFHPATVAYAPPVPPQHGRWLSRSLMAVAVVVLLSGLAIRYYPRGNRPHEPEPKPVPLAEAAPAAIPPTTPVRLHPGGWPLRQGFGLQVEPLGGRRRDGILILHPKERIGLKVRADRKCYITLFYRDDKGLTTLLFPNEDDKHQLLEPGNVRELPRALDGKPGIEATDPSKDLEYLHVVASTEPWKPPEGHRGTGSPYVDYETREQRERLDRGLRGLGLNTTDAGKGNTNIISEEVIPLRVER